MDAQQIARVDALVGSAENEWEALAALPAEIRAWINGARIKREPREVWEGASQMIRGGYSVAQVVEMMDLIDRRQANEESHLVRLLDS